MSDQLPPGHLSIARRAVRACHGVSTVLPSGPVTPPATAGGTRGLNVLMAHYSRLELPHLTHLVPFACSRNPACFSPGVPTPCGSTAASVSAPPVAEAGWDVSSFFDAVLYLVELPFIAAVEMHDLCIRRSWYLPSCLTSDTCDCS